MTTKDYVYLGLLLLTALAFYCNGFYAGVYRCKRMYDSLLDDPENQGDQLSHDKAEVKFLSEEEKVFAGSQPPREPKIVLSNRELRGNFGKN